MICKIFPNPNNEGLDINIQFNKHEDGTLYLLDSIDKKVWSEAFSGTTVKEQILLTDLIASTYMLIVKTATEEWRKKVVIF